MLDKIDSNNWNSNLCRICKKNTVYSNFTTIKSIIDLFIRKNLDKPTPIIINNKKFERLQSNSIFHILKISKDLLYKEIIFA